MNLADPAVIARSEGWRHQPERERREAGRVVNYWQHKLGKLGGALTLAGLDLDLINEPSWSHRFLIAVDPVIERSSLVLYGPQFAKLLNLPEQARADVPMLRQLPRRYAALFLRGCADVQKKFGPSRIEGVIERYDGKTEQYRAVFIPVRVKPNALTCFAFGAFNLRVVEPRTAA